MKTFTLPFAKTNFGVSQKQVDALCKFDNLKGIPSTSQVIKRMDQELYDEVLESLEAGEEVSISGK